MDTTKVLLVLIGVLFLAVLVVPLVNQRVNPVVPGAVVVLPAGKVLFADDFQQGLNAAWSTTHTWRTGGGYLWHDYDGTGKGYAYVLRGVAWGDYAVDADINPGSQGAGVIVRCQGDLMNYVLLRGNSESLRFQVIVNGGVAVESDELRPGFFAGTQHVRVLAKGSTYTVLVNNVQRLAFVNATFLAGMPGLASFGNYGGSSPLTSGVSYFDNFQVTRLD